MLRLFFCSKKILIKEKKNIRRNDFIMFDLIIKNINERKSNMIKLILFILKLFNLYINKKKSEILLKKYIKIIY